MDALSARIVEVEPSDAALEGVMAVHLDLMRRSSPACSVHAMDANRLRQAGARLFAAFEDGEAIAMGAVKAIAPDHAELKSMHVVQQHRGSGLAEKLLAHLLSVARDAGHRRVSLETGSQEAFAPARAFYSRMGFRPCPPFEGYTEDPNSVFMTRDLGAVE